MRKVIFVTMIIVLMMVSSGAVDAQGEVVGEIISVNATCDTILLKNNAGIREYKLALNASIKLNGNRVKVQALRPITAKDFQQAKIRLNNEGQIISVISFYRAIEIEVKKVNNEEIVVKYLNDGRKKSYSISKEVDIIRNNYSTNLSKVKAGDQGLIILGIDSKVKKMILHHYEVSGLLTDIDYKNKKITVNVGSRLNPKFKTFKLNDEVNIFTPKKDIKLAQLKPQIWVKLEIKDKVKSLKVRTI